MISTVATLALVLLVVLLPVLIPAVVSAFHFVAVRSARADVPTSSPRIARRVSAARDRTLEIGLVPANN